METLPHIIVVAGPTASGKSDFAVQLAKKCGGEVISADSCQIYKHLDIGTGKITIEEMQDVPHHMLSIIDIPEDFSVVEYRERALPLIENILRNNKTPIICGGTGQYLDAIMYTNTPPRVMRNTSLRKELEHRSTEELYQELLQLDAHRAKTIDRHNKVRLIRAIEIARTLGSVPQNEQLQPRYHVTMYLLNPSKEVLRERVHTRLLKRLSSGMVQEYTNLVTRGYDPKHIARRGIEYKHIMKFVNGEYTQEELVDKLRIATWQYAKRQHTWNKKYLERKVPINELHVVES